MGGIEEGDGGDGDGDGDGDDDGDGDGDGDGDDGDGDDDWCDVNAMVFDRYCGVVWKCGLTAWRKREGEMDDFVVYTGGECGCGCGCGCDCR